MSCDRLLEQLSRPVSMTCYSVSHAIYLQRKRFHRAWPCSLVPGRLIAKSFCPSCKAASSTCEKQCQVHIQCALWAFCYNNVTSSNNQQAFELHHRGLSCMLVVFVVVFVAQLGIRFCSLAPESGAH